MSPKDLVLKWFESWQSGKFRELPITDDFNHVSPYGTISGKQAYLKLVESNKEKFLGHRFEIHDLIDYKNKCCVRYTAIQGDFKLEVSEWHYIKEMEIYKVMAYYNIQGEKDPSRDIQYPDQ